MGILEYLLGPPDRDPEDAQPPPSKGGAGPNVDDGRRKTQTESDLRHVQRQYDPASDSFKEDKR
jgi:hypothetical protein